MANSLESKTRIVDLYRLFGHACQRRRCFRTHDDDEFRRETADYMISAGTPITQCRPDWASTRKPSAMGPGPPPRARGGPDQKAEDRELREARKRIRELEMENAFLKKGVCNTTG